jgi:eukaryotic-like serine/threonine-protein kinase
MGEVYRATDTNLKRSVAIKVLPESVAFDADRLNRLQREAEVLASLNHPNIAAIYGLERSGGTTALVMELVEGPTLADRIAQGAIPDDDALPIARQIADALEAAHERGIIHRDLKPANIKARDDGTVKVLDFGLAKALTPEPGSGSAVHLSQSPTFTSPAAMTGVGMLLGTAAYMSPEQAKGRPADKRSDVWSFGCVLYEMLTGRRAFDGEDVTETIAAIVRDQPDWTLLPANVPGQIRLLLKKCLEKDRRARVSDIAVARFLLAESIPSTAASTAPLRSRRRLLAIAAVSAFGVAMAAGGAWLGARFKSQPALSPARFVLAPPQTLPLFLQGLDRDIVISPDGSHIVYRSTTGSGGTVFAVRGINDVTPRVLGGTGGRAPFMSPDGRWIGYLAGGELRKVSITGGPSIAITTLGSMPRGIHWGADDRIVFGVVDPNKGLQSMTASGADLRSLTTPAREKGEVGHYYPFTMPDGKAVLFTIGGGSSDTGQIAVLDLQTGRYKTVIRDGSAAVFVEPDYLVYSSRGTLQAVRFDSRRLAVSGEPVPVIDQVMHTAIGSANFSVSRNGTLVYVAGGSALAQNVSSRSLVWVDRRGIETPVGAPTRPYGVARLSPDGTRVAVDIRGPGSDIWVWDLVRNTLTPLNLDAAVDLAPVWTQDGRKIIWSSSRGGGNPNVYLQSADGTGPVERLSISDRAQFVTAVTPDGSRFILFTPSVASGIGSLAAVDLFTAALDGRGQPPVPLLQSPAQKLAAEISPDGQWLAYQSDESGRHEVFVRPFPNVESGRWQISTEGGTRPAWSRKGDELFYLDGNDKLTAVRWQANNTTFLAGKPARVLNERYVGGSTTRGYDLRSYDVSVDGQRFLMLKETAGASTAAPLPTMTVVTHWIEELNSRVPAK